MTFTNNNNSEIMVNDTKSFTNPVNKTNCLRFICRDRHAAARALSDYAFSTKTYFTVLFTFPTVLFNFLTLNLSLRSE